MLDKHEQFARDAKAQEAQVRLLPGTLRAVRRGARLRLRVDVRLTPAVAGAVRDLQPDPGAYQSNKAARLRRVDHASAARARDSKDLTDICRAAAPSKTVDKWQL